jgi:hypothetical protein
MKCPNNVFIFNLGKDGIGSLISSALLRGTQNNRKNQKLKSFIPLVLQHLPYFLTEFKTGVRMLFTNLSSLISVVWRYLSNLSPKILSLGIHGPVSRASSASLTLTFVL